MPIAGPKVYICSLHAIKRVNRAGTIFVAELQLDPFLRLFTVTEDAITKLGCTTGLHFLDLAQQHFIANNKVGQVAHIMNSNIVTKVRADDRRMVQANGQLQIAVIQVTRAQIANTDQTVELTVLHLIRIEDCRYFDLGPVA